MEYREIIKANFDQVSKKIDNAKTIIEKNYWKNIANQLVADLNDFESKTTWSKLAPRNKVMSVDEIFKLFFEGS